MRPGFRRLVKAHKDRLYSLAVHLLGNGAEAEDVVQDVFVKLWEHLDELEDERIRPWLLRVTRNACLDLLRRRKYQVAFAMAAGAETETTVEATPLDALQDASLGESLNGAIQSLDEPFQSLVILREIQGFSYQEIGEALELSSQQVRVYLHRARRKLREMLENVLA